MTFAGRQFIGEVKETLPEMINEMETFTVHLPVTEEKLREECAGDEGLEALCEDMLEYCYRYTQDVLRQEILKKKGIEENLEEIQALDPARTALHNAMIDSVKILARNLRQKGKDISWIEGVDKAGRAGYARRALLLTFTDIIHAE